MTDDDETTTEIISYGDIEVTWVAPRVIVESAPDRTLISLQTVIGVGRDGRLLYSDGRLYLGDDRSGNEVVYRVTGWDADRKALIIERDREPETGP